MRLQPNLPEVQLAQAFYQAFVLHDYEGARPIFERLLTELPNNADVPFWLPRISLVEGRWDEPRAYLNKAIELNPREIGLRLDAAWVREAVRDFPGALRCYDDALAVWPNNPYLISGQASVYQSLGDLSKAEALLKNVHPTTKNDVGLSTMCDQAKFRRSYSDIIPFLTNFLELAASSTTIDRTGYRRTLGDLQRLSGDIKGATANYRQACDDLEKQLAERPGNADYTCEALAKAYAGLGSREIASKYIERAIAATPASKDAYVGPRFQETQARIEARFGQKEVAISILEHLLRIPYQSPITAARLRLDPDFDPLRGDPGFEKLAHSDGK